MSLTRTIFDFQNYYKNDFLMLKFFGAWIIDGIKKPKWYPPYFLLVNIFLSFSFNMSQLINLLVKFDNLRGFAAGGAYVITIAFMSNIRSFYVFKNRYELNKLICSLEDKDFQPKNTDQVLRTEDNLIIYERVKKLLTITCAVTVLASMVTPLVYRKNYQGIPFAAWFPFDISTSLIHALVYIYQCIAVTYVSYLNIYVDIIMAGLVTFITLQCDLLCDNLRNLGVIHDILEMEVYLKKYVTHHWKILRFVDTIEKLFSKIYFGHFAASTLAFCMTLFLMTLVEPYSFEFFYLVTYQFSNSLLLLLPCWFASEMTRKSEIIPVAAYECSWLEATSSFKKDLIYFIHRTQKPMKLRAVGFFNISVESFIWVLRASLSYFTVLNNINNGEKYELQ